MECDISYTQLSKAASGYSMPSWGVTRAYITSLNALSTTGSTEDIDAWFDRWQRAIQRDGTERTAPLRRRRARHARPHEPSIVPVAADPTSAVTPGEFVKQLKILKAWSGMSLAAISKIAGHGVLPATTISDNLRRSTLPKWPFVEAFVLACGGRRADVEVWQNAWRNIKVNELLSDTDDAPTGVRRVEQAMKVGPGRACEQVVETVDYLRKAGARVPRQRPAWLQEAVERTRHQSPAPRPRRGL